MRLRFFLPFFLLPVILSLTACAGDEPQANNAGTAGSTAAATLYAPEDDPAATPATADPAPLSTATPTPRPDQIAPTLTPTPTPLPGTGTEEDIVKVDPAAPPVPASDLLFIDDYALKLWSADDGAVRTLIPATDPDQYLGVNDFLLSARGNQALVVVQTGPGFGANLTLVHLDLETSAQSVVHENATRYAALALSPDGRRFTFAADSDTEPGGELTIYLDTFGDDAGPAAWGTCREDVAESAPEEVGRLFNGQRCSGAIFTRDGQNVIWADGAGLWIQNIEGDVTYAMTEHDLRDPAIQSGFYRPEAWSPSGRYLLLDVGHWEWTTRAVLDVPTGRVFEVPHLSHGPGPRTQHLTWMADDRLLMVREPAGFGPDHLGIYRIPDQGEALVLDEQRTFPTPNASLFAPFHTPGGDFRLAVVNRVPSTDEPFSGIYRLAGVNNPLQREIPLPPTEPLNVVGGTASWTDGGDSLLLPYATSDPERPQYRLLYVDLSAGITYDVTSLLGTTVTTYRWLDGT